MITGAAVLQEILSTAEELICEVIIATLPEIMPDKIRSLLESVGFQPANSNDLPKAWKEAVVDLRADRSFLMMKQLRDTRQVSIPTGKSERATRLMT
jgi:hypothetical protein